MISANSSPIRRGGRYRNSWGRNQQTGTCCKQLLHIQNRTHRCHYQSTVHNLSKYRSVDTLSFSFLLKLTKIRVYLCVCSPVRGINISNPGPSSNKPSPCVVWCRGADSLYLCKPIWVPTIPRVCRIQFCSTSPTCNWPSTIKTKKWAKCGFHLKINWREELVIRDLQARIKGKNPRSQSSYASLHFSQGCHSPKTANQIGHLHWQINIWRIW